MKLYSRSNDDLVRVNFGKRLSMAFVTSDYKKAFTMIEKVFSDMKVTKTLELTEHPVTKEVRIPWKVQVGTRQEGSNFHRNKGKGITRTIYGITDQEAMDYFVANYDQYNGSKFEVYQKPERGTNKVIRMEITDTAKTARHNLTFDEADALDVYTFAYKLLGKYLTTEDKDAQATRISIRTSEGGENLKGTTTFLIYGLSSKKAHDMIVAEF